MHPKSTGELINFGFRDRSVRSLDSANRWVQSFQAIDCAIVLTFKFTNSHNQKSIQWTGNVLLGQVSREEVNHGCYHSGATPSTETWRQREQDKLKELGELYIEYWGCQSKLSIATMGTVGLAVEYRIYNWQVAGLSIIQPTAKDLEQAANLLRTQANSASYPQRVRNGREHE